jgi:hypothetical protein
MDPLELIDVETDVDTEIADHIVSQIVLGEYYYPELCSSVLGFESRPHALPSTTSSYYTAPHAMPYNTSSYYTAPDLRPSHTSSLQSHSYYSAVSSPSYSTTNSGSTWSSNMSFPYSVTSINSRKSRKNVLYPRRTHPPTPTMPPPPPLAVPVPAELSHDVRLFSSCFLRLYEYRCSFSPPRPESGFFVHPYCRTRRPALCLREKCSSSRWGSLESFRKSCLPRLTKQLAAVPNYL